MAKEEVKGKTESSRGVGRIGLSLFARLARIELSSSRPLERRLLAQAARGQEDTLLFYTARSNLVGGIRES